MKNKASLLLMEQLIMILVFALAAALCLQVFAKAGEISQETLHRDQAVLLAQNAAELLKAENGRTSAIETLSRDGYQVQVISKNSQQSGLCQAKIAVFFQEELLFSLETGWQEVLP